MARSKALIIGAKPPFVGPLVSLAGFGKVKFRVDTMPYGMELNGSFVLESGDGDMVRAIVKEVEGVELVSIYAEEDDGPHPTE